MNLFTQRTGLHPRGTGGARERKQRTCLRSRCAELVSHLHHTLPNWLPQTFCLEREHTPQVSRTPSEDLSGPQHPLLCSLCRARCHGGFLRNLGCQDCWDILLSPHRSQTVVCSGLLGRTLWQNQSCWSGVCSAGKQESQRPFRRQRCGMSQTQIQGRIVKAGREEEIWQSLGPAPWAEWSRKCL